ncbi:MAG: transketolase [bacterium]|nr:transketolase [bacterium]
MYSAEKQILQKVADTVRVISAEAIEKAGCGHPGLPLGCAEIGAFLYARGLRHNPKNPNWMGRDRFVLSAGHGSMLLYSLLHLSGYDLSLDDLKNFRQLHSRTPGHPEFGEAPGVETTPGPLGQGLACATGMAIAQKILARRFGGDLFDAKIFALAGDGCIMEGISSEAASLAGHLGLGNLVIIYDANGICLDGPISECLSEDTAKRYEAYGFRVLAIDGHDFDQIDKAIDAARAERDKPVLIIARTIIGKGAPTKQGTNAVHGAKLGAEEVAALKKNLAWPTEAFQVPAEVYEYFADRQPAFARFEADWNARVAAVKAADPEKARLWETFSAMEPPADYAEQIWNLPLDPDKPGRSNSQKIIAKNAELMPFFFSGSADLSCSDSTSIKGGGAIGRDAWDQRNFKFGVREFSMAAACYGMALHGMVQPLCGTFLTFSDYMRNAIRIAALMKVRVFFQFTHDTVWMGEDGPTHQPIEQVASLRAMPGLTVFRPCDENEIKAAWIEALKVRGPVAFILSRQNVKSQGEATRARAREGVARGAYVLYGEPGAACDILLATAGSEVPVAMDVARLLEAQGKTVRVVSMPCWSRFDEQDKAYKAAVLGGEVGLRVSIEALATMGWHKYIGMDGLAIGIDRFGASAPQKALVDLFGFKPETIVERILAGLAVEA